MVTCRGPPPFILSTWRPTRLTSCVPLQSPPCPFVTLYTPAPFAPFQLDAYLAYIMPLPVVIAALRSGPAAAVKTVTTAFLLLFSE